MPAWLSSIGGIMLGGGGLLAAAVVFFNHILTTRKLKLEIDSLTSRVEASKKTILLPTPEQVDAVQRHLDAFQRQMESQRELLEMVIKSEDSIRKAVAERSMINITSEQNIAQFVNQLGVASEKICNYSRSQIEFISEFRDMTLNLKSISSSLIESTEMNVDATRELHSVASIVVQAITALQVSVDRVESRMERIISR